MTKDNHSDKEKEQVTHYCNTCKHSKKPATQKPCSECGFGKDEKWEARH